MRALILGAGGQVGKAIAWAAPDGVHLVSLARADCDVRSPDEVERAFAAAAPDIVFNAAAYTAVDQAEAEPDEAAAINALAPGIIAGAARRHDARMVHISTDYVFDGEASRPYRPGDPTNPLNVYGATKLAGEAAVHDADPSAVTVRTSWVYSSSGVEFRHQRCFGRCASGTGSRWWPTRSGCRPRAGCSRRRSGTWAAPASPACSIIRDSGSASWHDFAVAIQEQALSLGLLDKAIPIEPLRTDQAGSPARRPAIFGDGQRATAGGSSAPDLHPGPTICAGRSKR